MKGLVTSPSFYYFFYGIFSVMDTTGSIFVFSSSLPVNSSYPVPGDSVFVKGILIQQFGADIIETDSISFFSHQNITLVPKTVKALSESLEAHLLKINHVRLINIYQWRDGSAYNVYPILQAVDSSGIDTFKIYLAKGTYRNVPPTSWFNVTGIEFQNKEFQPYIGGYSLIVRDSNDLQMQYIKSYKIRDMKKFDLITGVADSVNAPCILKGVATSANMNTNGYSFIDFAIQDSTGSIIISGGENSISTGVGDSVEVQGIIEQSGGLTYLAGYEAHLLSSGVHPVSPRIVNDLNENDESELVTMPYCYVPDTITFNKIHYNFIQRDNGGELEFAYKFYAFRGKDSFAVELLNSSFYHSTTTLEPGYYDITGIEDQQDHTLPYFYDYVLRPRSENDFTHRSGIDPAYGLNLKFNIFPNPAKNFLVVNGSEKIDLIELADIVGKTIERQVIGSENGRLDLSNLRAGIYMLKIHSGINTACEKIVKE